MSEVTAARTQQEAAIADSPVLLRELEPWHRVFLRNLGDLFRSEPPPAEITSQPVELRKDYFIKTGVAPIRFLESYSGHIAFVIAVYLACTLPFFNRPHIEPTVAHSSLEYVPLSEYLPPINTAAKQQMKPRQGAPKLAKQEILSVPANPDNSHQTIVTPPKVKLNRDVAMPNIVAWTPVPSTQPIAASARSVSQLTVPQFQPEVVAPAADVSHLKNNLKVPSVDAPSVVAPTADVAHMKDNLKLPPLPQASVVEPSLSADQLRLKQGQINMADLQPEVAAPKLPVEPQRSTGVGNSGGAAAKSGESAGKSVPPSPSLQGLGNSQGQGQIIALSLNPDVRGPASLPSGNRSGEFHASPNGKADATGTPNVTGTGTADQGGGHGTGAGVPAGIVVGTPPPGANASAVGGSGGGSGNGNGKPAGNANSDATKRIFAEAMKPSLPAYHQPPPTEPDPDLIDPEKSIERRVFGSRRYYSLIMNMPNLTSATGSWIIRFAELKQSDDKTPLTAPVATSKMDPAYPADALRDHVEGTVTLYAIIRPDGSVDGIKVLNSLDERLDQNAIRALSHWHFRPGTKNGEAVAVEAVVQIPFHMHALQR